jgi:hypothetical protein
MSLCFYSDVDWSLTGASDPDYGVGVEVVYFGNELIEVEEIV